VACRSAKEGVEMGETVGERSKLENLLIYLTLRLRKSRQRVGRTKLMKLLYLTDLLARRKLGRTVTGATYRFYFYGPFSTEVLDALDALVERGILEDRPELTKFGVAHNYQPTKLAESLNVEEAIPEDEKAILYEVIKRFGRMNLLKLLDIVYATGPMKKVAPGELIEI